MKKIGFNTIQFCITNAQDGHCQNRPRFLNKKALNSVKRRGNMKNVLAGLVMVVLFVSSVAFGQAVSNTQMGDAIFEGIISVEIGNMQVTRSDLNDLITSAPNYLAVDVANAKERYDNLDIAAASNTPVQDIVDENKAVLVDTAKAILVLPIIKANVDLGMDYSAAKDMAQQQVNAFFENNPEEANTILTNLAN